MWKVRINLCILHHFDSETSHHFKRNFPSLSVTRHVSLFQECFHSNIKIYLETFQFIRMKLISSYCKRNNIMIYRITWNVFFIQWVARGKYRLSLFCITLKWAKPSYSIRSPWRPGIPRHFSSHVTPRSTLIGPWAQLQRSELQQKLGGSQGGSTNRSEFCHLWGIDKLIFWSHYVLKQLIGRLLLCGILHIMVNCHRNADCWKGAHFLEPDVSSCFVNTGASHMEARKANW